MGRIGGRGQMRSGGRSFHGGSQIDEVRCKSCNNIMDYTHDKEKGCHRFRCPECNRERTVWGESKHNPVRDGAAGPGKGVVRWV